MKAKTLALALSTAFILSACGNTAPNEQKATEQAPTQETTLEEVKEEPKDSVKKEEPKKDKKNAENSEDKVDLKAGDTWTVDGLWSITINSVKSTEERNQFDKTEPAQVVIIDYTYENLGYEDAGGNDELYVIPKTVIDGDGNTAQVYPAVITTHPKGTPVGAKMQNAQIAYGLDAESKEIKVRFEEFDKNFNRYVATFTVPVE